jgi:hypothetical protein
MAETSDGIARTSGASENRQEGGYGDRTHQQGQGKHNRNKNKNAQVRANKFKGDCEALETKGAVYVIGSQDYNQTTRSIAEYIAKTYQNAKDFRNGLVERVFPAIEPPDRPQDTNNIFEVEDWKLARRRWFEKTKEREENMGRAFPLILGQCEKPLQDRMMANSDWEDISRNHDVIGLLNLIQVCMHGRESGRYPTHTRMDADERFFKFYQKDLSDTVYYDRFKNIVDQCKLEGSKLGLCDKDIRAHLDENAADPDNPTAEETRRAEDACRSAYYAVAFIWHATTAVMGNLRASCAPITRLEKMCTQRLYPEHSKCCAFTRPILHANNHGRIMKKAVLHSLRTARVVAEMIAVTMGTLQVVVVQADAAETAGAVGVVQADAAETADVVIAAGKMSLSSLMILLGNLMVITTQFLLTCPPLQPRLQPRPVMLLS